MKSVVEFARYFAGWAGKNHGKTIEVMHPKSPVDRLLTESIDHARLFHQSSHTPERNQLASV
jgi:hypothetical protein